ncbi:MAG: ATP-dependent zinc metalloprotease FtsH [Fusobacteriota bacterium]
MGSNKFKLNFKNVVLLIFLLTVILSAPSLLNSSLNKEETISYSNFKNQIKNGTISKVEEKPPYVYTEKNGKVIKAKMISDRISGDQELVNYLENNNIELNALKPDEMPILLSILISWFPMLLLIGIWIYMLKKMNKGPGGNGGSQLFNMGKSKDKTDADIMNVTFEDVAGVDEAKAELEEVVKFLKEPQKFKNLGARIPKGVLLVGAPGTGKTLLAKAVAGEAEVPFFNISGSEFVEMFVGVGASRVRDLFNKAKKNSPALIFIDEIDAVARQRGAGMGGGNDEREQTLNQLLVEMDGFGTDVNIIVIAATNRPDVLDPAIERPGRFDRKVVVDKPDIKGREEILKVHKGNKKFADDIDLNVIARKTPGFSGADLANALNEAAILAARQEKTEIEMEDIEEAVEKVMAGPERKSRVMSEKEKKIIAYHESGHALIRWLLPEMDPVHKVSIIPRGIGALGYTMHLPEEDRFLTSKNELIKEIKTLLGGRAAEEIIFGDVTSGASNDIERATEQARKMITKYGMSSSFGPLKLGKEDSQPFLGREMTRDRNYSNETANLIDEEISKIINNSYDDVKQMIIDGKDKLEGLANYLLENEVISGDSMKQLFNAYDTEEDSEEKTEEIKEEKGDSENG